MSLEGESPELEDWLNSQGLGAYYQGIQNTGVRGSVELTEFTETDLKELGDELEMPKLMRRRFIRAVNSLLPKLEKKSSPKSTSASVPLGPEEHKALENLGFHMEKLESSAVLIGMASRLLKTRANELKEEIECNFNSLEIEIKKQKEEALAQIDSGTEKALKAARMIDKKTEQAVESANLSNDECMNAFEIKNLRGLSVRREKIMGIVEKALKLHAVVAEIQPSLNVRFSDTFDSAKSGLVTIEPPIVYGQDMGFEYDAMFTTLGSKGKDGPKEGSLSHYSELNHAAHVSIPKYQASGQIWTVPGAGLYELDACGAQGGVGSGQHGGKGGRVCVQFYFKRGTAITIVVGQKGVDNSYNPNKNRRHRSDGFCGGAGGGGCTSVRLKNSPLLIAAGGNGGGGKGWKTPAPVGRSFHGDGGEYKIDNKILTDGRGGMGASLGGGRCENSKGYECCTGDMWGRGGNGNNYGDSSHYDKYYGDSSDSGENYGDSNADGGFGGGGGGGYEGGGGGGYFGGVVTNAEQYKSSFQDYSATSYVDKAAKVISEADGYKEGDGYLHVKFITYYKPK